jgi:type II secretory pathway pseudopilin PulG
MLGNQRGMSLLTLMAVIAALAVLLTGAVALTMNVQANTANDRTRSKSFDVAEGALDYAMNQLAASWPGPNSSPLNWSDVASDFRTIDTFADTNEYPDPPGGPGDFSSVQFYDNIPSTNDAPDGINYNVHVDANGRVGDERMWIVARGATGSRASRVQAEVERTSIPTVFSISVAAWSGGDFDKIGNAGTIGVDPGQGGSSTPLFVCLGNPPDNHNLPLNGVTLVTPSLDNVPPQYQSINGVLPVDLQNSVIRAAQSMGTYFDLPRYPQGAPSDFSGVTVIKVPDGTIVDLPHGMTNYPTNPGILFVLGGPRVVLNCNGNEQFWGVLYSEGRLTTANGTQEFHGMVIAGGTTPPVNPVFQIGGNTSFFYDESAITVLRDKYSLNVSLVPNTWREVHP